MNTIVAVILGAFLSLAFVGLARRSSPRSERRVYAAGVVIAALIYVGFALAGGAGAGWLGLEVLGLFLYGAAAWAGLRGRPWLLALAWARTPAGMRRCT